MLSCSLCVRALSVSGPEQVYPREEMILYRYKLNCKLLRGHQIKMVILFVEAIVNNGKAYNKTTRASANNRK